MGIRDRMYGVHVVTNRLIYILQSKSHGKFLGKIEKHYLDVDKASLSIYDYS